MENQVNQEDLHTLIIYQNKYFEILGEFFISVTGETPRNFAPLDGFSNAVNRMPDQIRHNPKRQLDIQNAYATLERKLKRLYQSESTSAFRSVQKLNSCKLNLGGSSRFLRTQLNATRKSLLYSDTVLIPDPIMPWIEKARNEEKFQHVIPLQMAFFVLHLNDLIGSEFDLPPIFIFPSWEKSLEDNDPQTINNSKQLVADIFSSYVDSGIHTFEDVISFGDASPDVFLSKIDAANLFVSPGGEVGESLSSAIENYKAEIRQWRSDGWCEQLFSMKETRVVTAGICERIQPIYHLLENSSELRSHPLLCVDAQAHYYQLIAKMTNQRASQTASFDPSTNAILKALTSSRLDFLANIDDSQTVQLRKTNENVSFRKELRDLINSLSTTKLDDLGYVASEVCSHIESAISKQEKQIRNIQDKYAAKHKNTALFGFGALGVTMFPVLAPFIGTVPPLGLALAVAGKYVSDSLDEVAEKKQESRSMMGVIALAKTRSQP
jgi:hypothetical protein